MDLLRQRFNTNANLNLIKSSRSSRVSKDEINKGSPILFRKWTLGSNRKRRRTLQLLLLLVSLSLYLVWFRTNNGLQNRYAQRGSSKKSKSRHFKQASTLKKNRDTLIQKAASGLVRIGGLSSSSRLTGKQLVHAHLTVHQSAGSDCEVTWIKTGKPCQLVTNVVPPLDLLWTWQNTR